MAEQKKERADIAQLEQINQLIRQNTVNHVVGFTSLAASFSHSILKTLLSINIAIIIGYPLYLSQIPPSLAPEILGGLYFVFWFFLASLIVAGIASFVGYINFLEYAQSGYDMEGIMNARVDYQLKNSTSYEEYSEKHKNFANSFNKKQNFVAGTMWISIGLGIISAAFLVFGIVHASITIFDALEREQTSKNWICAPA